MTTGDIKQCEIETHHAQVEGRTSCWCGFRAYPSLPNLVENQSAEAAAVEIKMNERDWDAINDETGLDLLDIVMDCLHGRISAGDTIDRIAARCDAAFKRGILRADTRIPESQEVEDSKITTEQLIEAVYRHYGTDLQAFWRDAFAAQNKTRSDSGNATNDSKESVNAESTASFSTVDIPQDNSLNADPELDALSWSPSVEEADAYLRGKGIIKKCEVCGQDATLTNEFVTHLMARHSTVAQYLKRLENAFLMVYDLAGLDTHPLPEALPESTYVPGYMDKVRELREVFALVVTSHLAEHPSSSKDASPTTPTVPDALVLETKTSESTLTGEQGDQRQSVESVRHIDRLASELAESMYWGKNADTGHVRDLLIQFADEIKREAVEP